MVEVILHIGHPKTGTSTLQTTFGRNRDLLLSEQGILYPRTLGKLQHYAVPFICEDPPLFGFRPVGTSTRASTRRFWAENRGLRTRRDHRRYAADIRDAFAAEMDAAKPDRVLISSEFLWHLRAPRTIRRVRALFAPWATSYRVVSYLRRQDDLFLSIRSQLIKGGGVTRLDEPFDQRVLDHLWRLKLWEGVFDRPSMSVRPFVRSEMTGGDIVEDFCMTANIDPEGLDREHDRNLRLGVWSYEILRLMNQELRSMPISGQRKRRMRLRMMRRLEEMELVEPKLTAPQRVLSRLAGMFNASNTEIARRYLGRPNGELFTPIDPAKGGDAPPLDAERAVAIMTRLLEAEMPNFAGKRRDRAMPMDAGLEKQP